MACIFEDSVSSLEFKCCVRRAAEIPLPYLFLGWKEDRQGNDTVSSLLPVTCNTMTSLPEKHLRLPISSDQRNELTVESMGLVAPSLGSDSNRCGPNGMHVTSWNAQPFQCPQGPFPIRLTSQTNVQRMGVTGRPTPPPRRKNRGGTLMSVHWKLSHICPLWLIQVMSTVKK